MTNKNGLSKKEFLSRYKILIISAVIALFGLLLIVIQNFNDSEAKAEKGDHSGRDYASYIEDKLKNTLNGALGKNSFEVMVTTSAFYEKQFKGEESEDSSLVFSFSDSEKKSQNTALPITISDAVPEIKGVMIICKKRISNSYLNHIKLAVSTALSINQSQIYIIGGTDNEKNS